MAVSMSDGINLSLNRGILEGMIKNISQMLQSDEAGEARTGDLLDLVAGQLLGNRVTINDIPLKVKRNYSIVIIFLQRVISLHTLL
ncbi:hypothetical protein D3C72_587910 [compost metagenome]